jgi:hypothetical protein
MEAKGALIVRKTRKKKLEERQEKREKADQQRYAIAERILTMLDLKELIGPEVSRTRDYLISTIGPKVEVVVSDDSRQEPFLDDVRLEVAVAIEALDRIQIGDREVTLALGDILRGFYSVSKYIDGLSWCMTYPGSFAPRATVVRIEEARARVQAFRRDHLNDVASRLGHAISLILDNYLSFESHVLWFRLDSNERYPDRLAFRIVIGRRVQSPHYLPLHGLRRRAYRCDVPDFDRGLCPLTWIPRALGLGESRRPIPIFISEHAINRLYQRMPIGPRPHILHIMLRESLQRARIVPSDRENEVLVEAGVPGRIVGYFVVAVTPDFAFVKTFLFLTMQGTPEARKLREKARLNKTDIMLFKLDNLYTLGYSDLGEDADLRAVLGACGCGHLLDMLEPGSRLSWLDGHRDRLRRVVGLPLDERGPDVESRPAAERLTVDLMTRYDELLWKQSQGWMS